MNRLTSRGRKGVYLAGIVLLLIPIMWLGMPATGEEDSGGQLAQLRQKHDLGESTLGEVDPASATMNLVLLGFRGVAANLLHLEAIELKKKKNWAELRSTVDSIILLQPHYKEVWRFQGWNLAYNVSAQWDAVEDRYYWVKEGAKFMMRGSARNRQYPELYHDTGRFLGQKIGRADEWRFYRDFFLHDPNEEKFDTNPQQEPDPPWKDNRPDPAINPQGIDNYLAAKQWYRKANEVELRHEQHLMARILFRQYPARSQLNYAEALQREGLFSEKTRYAWQQGYREWTQEYGQELFETPGGSIRLEADDAELQELAENDPEHTLADKRKWVDNYQKMVNYRYWRTRAISEAESVTVAAHREIYQGQQHFKKGELTKAQKLLESGMRKFAAVLEKYPRLKIEDRTVEEGLMAVLYWQAIHRLNGTQVPQDFPLKELWNTHQQRLPELQRRFRRENGL